MEHGDIPENEPVIVFRAQDATLIRLLHLYEGLCSDAGSPEEHLTRISDNRNLIESWQRNNQVQVPGTGQKYTA